MALIEIEYDEARLKVLEETRTTVKRALLVLTTRLEWETRSIFLLGLGQVIFSLHFLCIFVDNDLKLS